MQSLYELFYKKLPEQISVLLPDSRGKLITFLNPYYMELLSKNPDLYLKFDYICSDGMVPIILNKIWKHPKSLRISFDMTSLAKELFAHIEQTGESIYFIGSEETSIKMFVRNIQKKYSKININGHHHGYIKNKFEEAADAIIQNNPDIVVIGMGAPMQDEFAIFLHDKGFKGTVYTCGGFFHQTTEKINYYPAWINKLNLRTLYRLIKEPYVFKRIIRYYPPFFFKYSLFLLNLKKGVIS